MKKRFFVDERGGCIAVRDSIHQSYDKSYNGLNSWLPDVITYFSGYSEIDDSGCTSWKVDPRLVIKCNEICNHLNDMYILPIALAWWNELPMQDIIDCKNGWANLVMKYFPSLSSCQNLSDYQILHIYKEEQIETELCKLKKIL